MYKVPAIVPFVGLSVNLKVLFPVVNLGFPAPFGFGIKKEPITVPTLSDTSLLSLIRAVAPLSLPTKVIPIKTLPP